MKFSIKKLLPNFPSITGGINRANKTAIFLFLVAMSSFSINSVSATSSEGCRSLERRDRMYEHDGEYGEISSTNSTFSLSDIAGLEPAEKGAVVAAARYSNNDLQAARYSNNNLQINLDPFTAKFLTQAFEKVHRASERVQQREVEANERAHQAEQREAEARIQKIKDEARTQKIKDEAEIKIQKTKAETLRQKQASDERAHQAEQREAEALRQKQASDKKALEMEYKYKKGYRREKRYKQRQSYASREFSLQERNYKKAKAEHEKVKRGLFKAAGTVGASALAIAVVPRASRAFKAIATAATAATTATIFAATGTTITAGISAVKTVWKEVPDNRKTLEQLQAEAKGFWPSSSDEDNSEGEGNNQTRHHPRFNNNNEGNNPLMSHNNNNNQN